MIVTHTTGERIDLDAMHAACDQFTTASGRRKETIRGQLIQVGIKVCDVRDYLSGPDQHGGKLAAGYAYLDTRDDAQREAFWLEWLHEYEACCDLLAHIEATALVDEVAA